MSPPLRRRNGGGGVLGLVTRHGGPLSVLIMGVTVGGLILLLIIQGSFFWPSSSSSSVFDGSSGSSSRAEDHHPFKGKQQQQWNTSRQLFLEALKSSPADSMCSQLQQHTSAKKLWGQYIGVILAASKHPDDPQFIHEDWTKRLLSELPPSLLQQATTQQQLQQQQSTTTTIPNLSRILEIIRKRLQNPDTAPPLRIAVVGGTFAEGEGCSIASVSVPEGSIMANPTYCAWPYRLQAFLDAILGGMEWVEVSNLSEGGTDTGFMIPLMRNWIYPKHLLPHGPDIIVNAYGRYDYETYGEASSKSNLKETIQSEMTTFLRAVQVSHPCGDPPMVIHMDDVGIELLDNNKNNKIFQIHHKDALDRAMQADRQRGDFAMAGHMAMTWVLAFGALEAALRHCEQQPDAAVTVKKTVPTSCQDASTGYSPCPFAFFASPQGTVTRVTEFQKYLKPYTVGGSAGWGIFSDMSTGWARKTGLVAITAGAKIVLHIKNIEKEVRYFHLMTLKSNVNPWRTGKVRFRVAILAPGKENQPVETSFEIDGNHQTSKTDPEHITHHYNMDFEGNKAPVGSDIMLSLELVEGTNFKVLGLMLCS
jgi:hypothetical protein